MKFEYWKSKGLWYWHLKARNGKIIAQGEGYKRHKDCRAAVELIAINAFTTPIFRIGK